MPEKKKRNHGPGRPFQKGQSPNPGGRPLNFEPVVRRLLADKLGRSIADVFGEDGAKKLLKRWRMLPQDTQLTIADAVSTLQLWGMFNEKSSLIRLKYQDSVNDRSDGKPVQQLEIKRAELDSRTDEELEFFIKHKCWPEQVGEKKSA